MGWLRRGRRLLAGGQAGETVAGRAVVAPASTHQHSGQFDDGTQHGSFSANERLWVQTTLRPSSVADGGSITDEWQSIRTSLPNWVASVLHAAGTNEPLAAHLPASIEVPVTYDAGTRRIVDIDVRAATVELEPLRPAAVEHFKRTDSWLAPLRNIASLPGDAVSAVADSVDTWKSAVGALADEARNPGALRSSWTAEEVEAVRRNASILAVRFQQKPKERDRARTRALQALPLQAEQVAAGSLSPGDFDVLVMREEVSTAISPAEAAAFRRDAGLPAQ